MRMAFYGHFEKPQPALVLDERLWQPGKGKAILPTQEEDQPMRPGKRGRHLSKGEERDETEIVSHGAALPFLSALTPDRWADFETLVGPRGACAGCWCMWWRLTSREFRDGAGVTNRDRFQEMCQGTDSTHWLLYGHREVIYACWISCGRNAYPGSSHHAETAVAMSPRVTMASFGRRLPLCANSLDPNEKSATFWRRSFP